MNVAVETPLERACAKLKQVERELKKLPDFQLYLIARSQDRARMKRLLMQIPHFRLWRILTNSAKRAHRHGLVDPERNLRVRGQSFFEVDADEV